MVVKMLQRWKRESRRSRRKQQLRRSGLPLSSSLLFSGVINISPSFQFSTADLHFCNWAQRPLQSAGGECTTVSCSLGKYFATSTPVEEVAQPGESAIFAPSVLSDQGGEIQGCHLLRSVRTAQRKFNHGFGVSNGPCNVTRKFLDFLLLFFFTSPAHPVQRNLSILKLSGIGGLSKNRQMNQR